MNKDLKEAVMLLQHAPQYKDFESHFLHTLSLVTLSGGLVLKPRVELEL